MYGKMKKIGKNMYTTIVFTLAKDCSGFIKIQGSMKHKSKTSKWNWKCESKSETILNPKILLFSSSPHNSVAFCIIAWASYDCAAGEILVIVTIGCNCKIIVRYENYWLSESMSIEPKRREEISVMTAFTTHFVSLVPKHFGSSSTSYLR